MNKPRCNKDCKYYSLANMSKNMWLSPDDSFLTGAISI